MKLIPIYFEFSCHITISVNQIPLLNGVRNNYGGVSISLSVNNFEDNEYNNEENVKIIFLF